MNRTPALTNGGDNADVLPETFQAPTAEPGWTATPVTLSLAILFVARKAKKGDFGHLAAERQTQLRREHDIETSDRL